MRSIQKICAFHEIFESNISHRLDNSIRFCSVHSFKGLESKIIILIDVQDILSESAKLLNYTAISRAKVKLYIFANEINEAIVCN